MPGHGEVTDKSYIPEMSKTVQSYIDAAKAALKAGMNADQVSENSAFLEKHGIKLGDDPRAKQVIKMSFTRLLEVLKN